MAYAKESQIKETGQAFEINILNVFRERGKGWIMCHKVGENVLKENQNYWV